MKSPSEVRAREVHVTPSREVSQLALCRHCSTVEYGMLEAELGVHQAWLDGRAPVQRHEVGRLRADSLQTIEVIGDAHGIVVLGSRLALHVPRGPVRRWG